MSERPTAEHRRPEGVVMVGAGARFLSGITHYTRYAALALAERVPVAVILMRELIPRRLYPGAARVGASLSDASYPESVAVFDGIDWNSPRSLLAASRFMRARRPAAVVLQWWTGAVLHSYLTLALAARRSGAAVLVELHEMQDTGESGFAFARWYGKVAGGALMRLAAGFIVHSEFDAAALRARHGLGGRPVRVLRLGPFHHYEVEQAEPLREAPAEAFNILFFGTVRPYKGLEDLVRAFESALDGGAPDLWLTVVGETWEGWELPIELIERSPHRARITLVNRYVSDAEASRWFAGADAAALPYRRSSASGPLHMTMSAGLPVVVTAPS